MNSFSWACANPYDCYCKSPFTCRLSSWQSPYTLCLYWLPDTFIFHENIYLSWECSSFCKSNFFISIGFSSIFNVLHFFHSERRHKWNSQGWHCLTWLLYFRKSTVSPLHMNHQISNFQRCKHACCKPASVLYYCTFQSTVWLKILSIFVFLCTYYLCEKYYKPIIVKCYPADCVSWVPKVTLLDLQTY